MIATIREDHQLSIYKYRNARKAEVTRVMALAVAGTEDNEWWCLDWGQNIRHFEPDICLNINLMRCRFR